MSGAEQQRTIRDVLRSEGEAARAEIRAAGFACPSCQVNMADVMPGHKLEVNEVYAVCASGAEVKLAEALPSAIVAVIHFSLMDRFLEAEDEVWELINRSASPWVSRGIPPSGRA